MTVRRILIAAMLVAASALSRAATAQQPVRPIDRIVAIVGTRPILSSQVDEEIVRFQAQGGEVPQDSAGRAKMRRQFVDRMLEEELVVQQAQRDTSVKVTDQEVLDAVEQTYQNARKQFSSELEFQNQLRAVGLGSVEEWRRQLAEDQRRRILQDRLFEHLRQKGKLRPIPPTDAQMHDFWEANKAQQPKRPATVSFRQIVVKPQPDSAARARAYQRAESLQVALRHGADFASVAKRFSADTASREQGGELGWFRRGVMFQAFEDMAFRLRPGQISDIVETPFGFHIIKVDRAQPAEVLARHVLIMPDVSPVQVEIARRLADSVHAALARRAPFDSLARRASDPEEPKLAEDAPITQLPQEYQDLLARDTTVGLKPVITVGAESGRPKFVVFEVTRRLPEGELAFADVKGRVKDVLANDLAIRHYIDDLRQQTYIDVRF